MTLAKNQLNSLALYNKAQFNPRAFNDHLTSMFKIHGYFSANYRLHLAHPPIRFCRMAHQISRCQKIIHLTSIQLKRYTPMLSHQLDLAAAIGARICHDLIGPIGAISNGLELLELSGAPQSPEMVLISESVKNANAKVRFLRIAFGDTQSAGTVTPSEVNDILSGCFDPQRLAIKWAIPNSIEQGEVKLLFLFLLCAEKLAAYGGAVTIAEIGRGYHISIIGQSLKTEGFLDFHANKLLPKEGPPYIQFYLAQSLLDQMRYRLEMERNTDKIDFVITA